MTMATTKCKKCGKEITLNDNGMDIDTFMKNWLLLVKEHKCER